MLFSKPGETADELIRRLVRAEPPGRPVVVVSSDREVADGVRRSGARPVLLGRARPPPRPRLTRRPCRTLAPSVVCRTSSPDVGRAPARGESRGGHVIIDCDSCEVRGLALRRLRRQALLGGPPGGIELDDGERAAIDALAGSGLVPPLRLVLPSSRSARRGLAEGVKQ